MADQNTSILRQESLSVTLNGHPYLSVTDYLSKPYKTEGEINYYISFFFSFLERKLYTLIRFPDI